jgi:hypothetical protein
VYMELVIKFFFLKKNVRIKTKRFKNWKNYVQTHIKTTSRKKEKFLNQN